MYNYYNKYFISKEADKMLHNSSDSKQAMYEAIKLAKQKVNKNTLDNLRDMSIGELKFVPKK